MTFLNCKSEYESYLAGRGLKEKTLSKKLSQISSFLRILPDGEDSDLREICENDFITFAQTQREKDLSRGTIVQYLSGIRQFFIWLYKNELILCPVSELIPLVKAKSIEKTIFTGKEIDLFLNTIDTSLRDRVFFELLYSSGLRCSEGLNLKWKDIFISMRKLKVEQGKGGRDRFVPFCNCAATYLKRWKKVNDSGEDDYLFPGLSSGHLTYHCMVGRFRKYLKESEISKEGLTIHSIRHSTATHLLEAGADVRYVSELLGHNSMETTVKYTHPTEESQKKAFRMYHPRENAYYKELGSSYKRELKELRKKFHDRSVHVSKYVKK